MCRMLGGIETRINFFASAFFHSSEVQRILSCDVAGNQRLFLGILKTLHFVLWEMISKFLTENVGVNHAVSTNYRYVYELLDFSVSLGGE